MNVKPNFRLLVAVTAGLFAGAVGSRVIHGAETGGSPVYVISEADSIADSAAMKNYGSKVSETLAPFNGHYHFVVRGGKLDTLDGDPAPQGIVVIAFDSADQAQAWYHSPAYSAIKPIRLAAGKGRMFVAEGVTP